MVTILYSIKSTLGTNLTKNNPEWISKANTMMSLALAASAASLARCHLIPTIRIGAWRVSRERQRMLGLVGWLSTFDAAEMKGSLRPDMFELQWLSLVCFDVYSMFRCWDWTEKGISHKIEGSHFASTKSSSVCTFAIWESVFHEWKSFNVSMYVLGSKVWKEIAAIA